MNEILKDLGLSSDNSKLEAVYRKIKPNKPAAKIKTRNPGFIYQADLLFMPEDDGYKYILTVVDTNNNMCDAEPLKDKNAETVLAGMKSIFGRKPLHYPKFSLETDPGAEFNNKIMQKYLNDRNILLRLGTAGRSDQQAVVEYYNGLIAAILFKFMTNDELQTGETSTEWTDELPKVIKALNKNLVHDKSEQIDSDVLFNSKEELVPIGTEVRTALNKPVGVVDNKKLFGNFRATDHRWTIKTGKVEDISLRPNQPPLYKVDNVKNNYFTRNQIQVVKENETLPVARKHIIEKIIKKIYRGRKPYFEIQWQDGSTTEEPRAQLIKDVPVMIKSFEKENK